MIKLLWFLLLALFLDTSDNDDADDDADADSDDANDDDGDIDAGGDDSDDGKGKSKDDLKKTFGEVDQLDEKGAKNQLKARLEQYQRLCRKLSKMDAQIKRLSKQIEDAESTANAELRKENSFLRAAISSGESLDLKAAWILANTMGFMDAVTVDEEGNIDGMEMP